MSDRPALRFDVNVSILFRELPFLERFDAAARAGFGAVEFWWPADDERARVARRVRDAGLEVVAMNLDAGDMAAGDRGLLNDPARRGRLAASVPEAIELAERVGCRRLNALAGHWRPGVDRAAQLDELRETVEWIAGRAGAAGIEVLLEAVNPLDNGPYVFTTAGQTVEFIRGLDARNVAFQLDVFHLQRAEGNVTASLRAHRERIGHVQVADSPDRGPPGTGELDFRYLLSELAATGYDGWVGLEFLSRGGPEVDFGWLPADRAGPVPIEALRL